MPITYAHATAAQVSKLCERVFNVLEGENPNQVNIACLTIAMLIQVPEITPENLVEGVKGASEWIALYGDTLRNPTELKN